MQHAVRVGRGDRGSSRARAESHFRHCGAFVGSRAFAFRVGEQCRIEVRAFDLVTMGVFPVEAGREVELDAFAGFVGDELGAVLSTPILAISSRSPSRSRIARFLGSSDSPMWKRGCPSFSRRTTSLPARQSMPWGRTAGPATNDQDLAGLLIVRLRIHHRHPVSVTYYPLTVAGRSVGRTASTLLM